MNASIFPLAMHRAAMVLTLFLLAENSRAQWTAIGAGPFLYDDTANWKDGTINDQILASPEAEQVIHLTTDRIMPQGLLINQPTAPDGRHYSLVFKARNANDSAAEPRKLALGGPIVVDFGTTNDLTAFLGEKMPIDLDFGGAPAVIEMVTGNSHLELRGSILNAQGLTVKGSGRVILTTRNSGLTGSVGLEGARLSLSGRASLPGINALSLAGRTTLALENDQVGALDRLPDSAPITCAGLTEIRLTADAKPSEETLGKVFLNENCLELWASAKEGGDALLALTELVRKPDTMLIIGYENPKAASRVKVMSDKIILEALVGGNGSEGLTTASIVPWVRGHGGGNLYTAAGFLTYSHDDGFRELAKDREYVQDLNTTSNPADNARIATGQMTLAESKTLNSLFMDPPDPAGQESGLDLGGNTLTITSGAVSLSREGQISNGTLTTGNDRPLVISGPVFMNARLEGTGGLIYFGGRHPELRLGGTENTLTGDYVVLHGAIRLADSENIPDPVTVRLHKGAELIVDGSESLTGLAGVGRVRLATQGRSVLVLGRSEGSANQVVVGQDGEVHPGDISRGEQATGDLVFWQSEDNKDHGSLEFEDGTLFIDVAEGSIDALVFDSENKIANVTGGTLSVNLLGGYEPKIGAKWDIIKGTGPATGQGFENIEDATGTGYKYSAKAVGNNWVLELVATP